jgi:hypothetical protein
LGLTPAESRLFLLHERDFDHRDLLRADDRRRGSVPMTSVFIFATLGPAVLTLLVMLFVGRNVESGRPMSAASLGWRTVVAGGLVPVGVAILSIPSSIFGGNHPNTAAQSVVFIVELAAFAAVAIPVLLKAWRHGETGCKPSQFVRIFGPVYLVVLGILWLTALPDHLSAKGGVTSDGTTSGNVFYAALCSALAALWVTLASTVTAPRSASDALSRTRAGRLDEPLDVRGEPST